MFNPSQDITSYAMYL